MKKLLAYLKSIGAVSADKVVVNAGKAFIFYHLADGTSKSIPCGSSDESQAGKLADYYAFATVCNQTGDDIIIATVNQYVQESVSLVD